MDEVQKHCRNCNFPISTEAKYCSQCSQKNTDGKVPLWSFIKEFFTNLFNIDSKLFLTFFALFIPGKLTVEYFKGKHKSYASPVRLFLYAGVLLFAIVISQTSEIDIGEGEERLFKRSERIKFRKSVIKNIDDYKSEFLDSSKHYQADSLSKWLISGMGSPSSDTASLGLVIGDNKQFKIARRDLAEMPIDSILVRYNIKSRLNSIFVSQQVKAMRNSLGMFHFFIGKLPIMIFFMMPFLALILKVLYTRRKFYFVEHLVFSFHYHTFAFIIIMILVLFGSYFHGLLIAAFILAIFIYQFMAMRRYYKQGFFKTFLKFSVLNFLYLFLSVFFFSIAASISFLLF